MDGLPSGIPLDGFPSSVGNWSISPQFPNWMGFLFWHNSYFWNEITYLWDIFSKHLSPWKLTRLKYKVTLYMKVNLKRSSTFVLSDVYIWKQNDTDFFGVTAQFYLRSFADWNITRYLNTSQKLSPCFF